MIDFGRCDFKLQGFGAGLGLGFEVRLSCWLLLFRVQLEGKGMDSGAVQFRRRTTRCTFREEGF